MSRCGWPIWVLCVCALCVFVVAFPFCFVPPVEAVAFAPPGFWFSPLAALATKTVADWEATVALAFVPGTGNMHRRLCMFKVSISKLMGV